MPELSDSSPIQGRTRFRKRRRWMWLALAVGILAIAASGVFLWNVLPLGSHCVAQTTAMPVRYDEDRFFVEPVTARGAKLELLADTGGGLFLTREAVDRGKSRRVGRSAAGRLLGSTICETILGFLSRLAPSAGSP